MLTGIIEKEAALWDKLAVQGKLSANSVRRILKDYVYPHMHEGVRWNPEISNLSFKFIDPMRGARRSIDPGNVNLVRDLRNLSRLAGNFPRVGTGLNPRSWQLGDKLKKVKTSQWVKETNMIPGIVEKEAAAGHLGKAIGGLGRALAGIGTKAGGRELYRAGVRGIKAFGGGGPATQNALSLWKGSPMLRNVAGGSLLGGLGGGLGGMYTGYQQGGLGGALAGGFSGLATGALSGGILGGLAGPQLGTIGSRFRKGVGGMFAPTSTVSNNARMMTAINPEGSTAAM